MNKIIYLDAAASALKPRSVIDAEFDFLQYNYANAGRGVCARAAAADAVVARGRAAVATFINARPDQIIWTSGTTDAINRIVNIIGAACGGRMCVAVSDLDHHSARLPWENLVMRGGAEIVHVPLDAEYNYDMDNLPRADVMIITAMSNVLGVAQDVREIIARARQKNPDVITIVDAAQYVVHNDIDADAWGADFICFSAHKIGADTGLGIMYMRNPSRFAPDKFGGGMVGRVYPDGTFTVNSAPDKFEAGTLPLTQIAGIPAAIDDLTAHRPDIKLVTYLYDQLSEIERIRILSPRGGAILSFVVDGMHVLDFGALMGARDVCVRVGNMCASWIHMAMGVPGSVRMSVGNWNTMDEMQRVVEIVKQIVK